MKRVLIALALLSAPGAAFAQTCGLPPLPPLPPLGCTRMEPVCICTADGRCFWQFVCVRE